MSGNAKIGSSNRATGTAGWVVSSLLKGIAGGLFLGAILFISAGRLDWPMAWIYTLVSALDACLLVMVVSPDLMKERAHPKADTKAWDRVLAHLTGPLGSTAMLIVAGLNVRFGWPPQVPFAWQAAGLVVFVLGVGLMTWAMIVNNFFSLVVRIQKDRGHTVVSSGPYAYVRHPGYVGGILFQLATPVMLGTLWALIPAGLAACCILVRTALEDKTLQAELNGYKDYAARVHYRLLPGVW